MPFTRVTLVNTNAHDAAADVHVSPPAPPIQISAPANQTTVVYPAGVIASRILKSGTTLTVVGGQARHPLADLGQGGDEILEAVITVQPDHSLPDTIAAKILRNGLVHWETVAFS